jgi:rhodanese-related sulfurtransferase
VKTQTLAERQNAVHMVDVRHPHEWQAGRIAGAMHIPLDELERRMGEIDRSRQVVTVCRSGNRSTQAMELLRDKGFEAYSLDGGLAEWAASGLPLIAEDGMPGRVADSAPPEELSPEFAASRDTLIDVAYALQDRFGNREPTDEEARTFMLDWLVSKGETREEAARLLNE